MDPGLSQLLQWSVANTSNSKTSPSTENVSRELNPNAMNALFGGPSDAELMVSSMAAIQSNNSEITLEDKLIAFDNLEQLIENLDNANNLENTKLWAPLIECLDHEEKEIRKMAAWCIGTAVQNNINCQDVFVAKGGLQKLILLACSKDEESQVRRKAIYAISSACRNHQPAMDELTTKLCELEKFNKSIDATDMDACDKLMGLLRKEVADKI